MKMLSGREIAGFIKERQAKAVRSLRQSTNIFPKLAIIQCKDDPVIDTYVRLKKAYGKDIGIGVDIHKPAQTDAVKLIKELNSDKDVHGIIVQLPLKDPSQTEEIVNLVAANKDVDALGRNAAYDPATPMAILWLLAGYNIELNGKEILIIGHGKLVGAPMFKILKNSGYKVAVADRNTDNLGELSSKADVIITATGSPAILFPDMIKIGAVVVDAGTSSESGQTVGDLSPAVYERRDLIVTPARGGVGPLTVCALFENVIKAASN